MSAYAAICDHGVAARAAFAAAHFGEYAEAVFWLQLPKALALLSAGSAGPAAFWSDVDESSAQDTVQGHFAVDKNVQKFNKSDMEISTNKTTAAVPPSSVGTPPAWFKMVHVPHSFKQSK